MHPLSNAANGSDHQPRNDTDDSTGNNEAYFTAANQSPHAKGNKENPQIPIMPHFSNIHHKIHRTGEAGRMSVTQIEKLIANYRQKGITKPYQRQEVKATIAQPSRR